jgi:superfamily II DNA/RNA helicase
MISSRYNYKRRFKWLRPTLFNLKNLKRDLLADVQALISVLNHGGAWDTEGDEKLDALVKLLEKTHSQSKVLVFTQFADTVHYLTDKLKAKAIARVEGVTGRSKDPTEIAGRFSPVSSGKRDRVPVSNELRVLIATDVLSEGHNSRTAPSSSIMTCPGQSSD